MGLTIDSMGLGTMLGRLKIASTWIGLVLVFAVARLVHTFVHRLRDYQVFLTSMQRLLYKVLF